MSNPDRKHLFKVKELASNGISPRDIAAYLNIKVDELISDYSDIINTATVDKSVEVANTVYRLAVEEGNLQACIFWLKSIAKIEEKDSIDSNDVKNEVFDAININIVKPVDEKE